MYKCMLIRKMEVDLEKDVCEDCKEKHQVKNENEIFTILLKEYYFPFIPNPGIELNMDESYFFIESATWMVDFNGFELILAEKSYSEELYDIEIQKALDSGWEIIEESSNKEEQSMLN